MAIFTHIEHILHNDFATFHCALGFIKFLTFLWLSLCSYKALLANGILVFTIKVGKEESHQIDQTLPH
jgi:hypothetical protein